jgi:hypothetical protein
VISRSTGKGNTNLRMELFAGEILITMNLLSGKSTTEMGKNTLEK